MKNEKNRMIAVRTVCAVMILLCVLPLLTGCGMRLDGTYSCMAADTGEAYTFDGNRVTVVLYVMGKTLVEYSGTYRIRENKITFTFPEDKEDIYNGTFAFSISSDGSSIEIGETTFVKA